MIEVTPLSERVIKALHQLHPGARWIWKYTGPTDATVDWVCSVCKRREQHAIDLVRLHRANLATLSEFTVLRTLADSFANHVCKRNLEQVVNKLVEIIIICGHCWWESLDDTTKRFLMMELT